MMHDKEIWIIVLKLQAKRAENDRVKHDSFSVKLGCYIFVLGIPRTACMNHCYNHHAGERSDDFQSSTELEFKFKCLLIK